MKDGIPREKVERLISIYKKQAKEDQELAGLLENGGHPFSSGRAGGRASAWGAAAAILQKLLDGEL